MKKTRSVTLTGLFLLAAPAFTNAQTLLIPTGGSPTGVNIINEIPNNSQPTYVAGNSSNTFAETQASPALSAAAIAPNPSFVAAAQAVFNGALTQLNASAATPGSAAFLKAAKDALDADPANAVKQSTYDSALSRYTSNNQTLNNLKTVVAIGAGDTVNSVNIAVVGSPVVSGLVTNALVQTAGNGAIQAALDLAATATASISTATAYFNNGGAAGKTDVEANVIAKIQPLSAGTVGGAPGQYTAGGFLNSAVTTNATSQATLTTQQAAYDAVINNPVSTAAQITTARVNLTTAETAFAASVQALYTGANFTPITDVSKNNLLGAVLNGSWERNAINTEATTRTGLIHKDVNGLIHIGANSLIVNDTASAGAGNVTLTANDFNGAPAKITVGTGLTVTGAASLNGGLTTTGAVDLSGSTVNLGSNSTAVTQALGTNNTSVASTAFTTSAVASESARATTAEGALQTNIDTESATRAAADTVLQTNIDTEASTRATADTTEANTRSAADTVLQTNINTEVATRDGLIRTGSDGLIHIGSNSLIVNDTASAGAGNIILTANDFNGNPANITVGTGFSVTGATTLNGGLTTSGPVNLSASSVNLGANATAVTQAAGTNNTSVATTAFTTGAVATETTRATTAETGLQTNINTEAATRAAAITTEANTRAAAITTEANTRSAADTVLQTNITTEATTRAAAITTEANNRSAADTVLQNKINTEASTRVTEMTNEISTRAAADTVLSNRIVSEAGTRSIADRLIRHDFQAADVHLRNDYQRADNSIRNDFRSADRKLDDKIDTNTRGIAMVAAMTNTTILPGNTMGMDFNMSYFEGEAGIGFGYAVRVNEHLQLNAALAATTQFDTVAARAGASVQW